MSSPDVIVVGAGVLGLCVAAELSARGHAVTVLDPGGPNASSVAAGMLAPAFESVLEDADQAHADLLRRARDLWPAFARGHGLGLDRCGAEWRGADAEAVAARLAALGFDVERTDRCVSTADDWRIGVAGALERLRHAPGVTVQAITATSLGRAANGWRVETSHGRPWTAPVVVLATGAATPVEGLPKSARDLVASVEPIRGQVTPVACVPPSRIVRSSQGYAAPVDDGVVFGATMEPGRRDVAPDADTAARQVALGTALTGLSGDAGEPRVGIRGATADGLPMAGAVGGPGLFLALAPRRNGWLLGPLVGRTVADAIEGRAPGADARALDPLRFA